MFDAKHGPDQVPLNRSNLPPIPPGVDRGAGIAESVLQAKSRTNPIIAGHHPLDPAPESSLLPNGKMQREFLNIYVARYHGVSVATGGHTNAHHTYCDEISRLATEPLTTAERDYLGEYCVDGFVMRKDGGAEVKIRPDRNANILLRAIDVLHQIGVQNHDLVFGTGCMTDQVAMIGRMHQMETICPSNPRDKLRYIQEHYETTPTGLRCYYVEERGERLLTPHEVGAMIDIIAQRDVFLARLAEVIEAGGRQSKAGGNDLDFLFVSEKLTRKIDKQLSQSLLASFSEVHELAKRYEIWTEHQQERIAQMMWKILDTFCANTHELFRKFKKDLFENAQWRGVMYLILRHQEADILQLGQQYTGTIQAVPGGMIGYRDGNGLLMAGPRIVRLGDPDLELSEEQAMEAVKSPVVLPADDRNHSARVYTALDGHGIEFEKREFEFAYNVSQQTIDLLNWVLSHYPELDYAYICEVPESLSSRDALIDTVEKYWSPPRQVHVVVFKTLKGKEQQLLVRRADYPTYFWEHIRQPDGESLPREQRVEYGWAIPRFQRAQRDCLRYMGIQAPDVEVMHVTEEVPELQGIVNNWRNQRVEHMVRRFISGDPLNSISRFHHPSREFTLRLAALKGEYAAVCLVSRQHYFGDGDEIISKYDQEGNPAEICQVDSTSSFPSQQDAPMQADAPLYAADLAADIAAAGMVLKNNGELLSSVASERDEGFSAEVEATFLSAMTGKLLSLQSKAKQEGQKMLEYVDHWYRPDESIPADCDMRSCWREAVQGLIEADVAEVVEEVCQETTKLRDFYEHIVTGLKDVDEIESLMVETGEMLASCWQSTRGISQDTLIDTVMGDQDFTSLPSAERLYRLYALRASSWAARKGVPIDMELFRFASDCMTKASGDLIGARSAFAVRINEKVRDVHFHSGVPEKLFDALFEGPEASQRFLDLNDLNYFLSR